MAMVCPQRTRGLAYRGIILLEVLPEIRRCLRSEAKTRIRLCIVECCLNNIWIQSRPSTKHRTFYGATQMIIAPSNSWVGSTCQRKVIHAGHRPCLSRGFRNLFLEVCIRCKSLGGLPCFPCSLDSLDPSNAQTWYLLGRAHMCHQAFPKAYEAYQEAVLYCERRAPIYWISIGKMYYDIDQYLDSREAISRALRLNENIWEAWYNLGILVSPRSSLHCDKSRMCSRLTSTTRV